MDERTFVAAIDFGTCNTKMAFAYRPQAQRGTPKIYPMDAWESASGRDVMAPTSILTDRNGEVKAYGYHAEQSFRQLDKSEVNRFLLFKDFKMFLHQKEVR